MNKYIDFEKIHLYQGKKMETGKGLYILYWGPGHKTLGKCVLRGDSMSLGGWRGPARAAQKEEMEEVR
jgi:hypothetical protein